MSRDREPPPKTPLEQASDDWLDREVIRDPVPRAEALRLAKHAFREGVRWLARELEDALPGSGRSELNRLIGEEP